MINAKGQEILGRVLTLGVLGVTLFLEAWKSSEPVNAPKMLLLSTFGLSALFVILTSWNKALWTNFKVPIILLSSFLLFCVVSVALSDDNVLVGIFGTKGRSTGLVTYFSLAIFFFSAVLIQNRKYYDKIIYIFVIAGLVNISYNILFMFGFDPVPWNNPFGTILGTFGNPNFISSFLGMLTPVLLAIVLNQKASKKVRCLAAIGLPIAAHQIVYSNSIQGIFVSAVGLSTVIFLYLISRSVSKPWIAAYLSTVGIVGITSLLGMLQRGPLESLIYKTSVSLRGEYWAAGINMGINNPFSGVGLDSYGNWYRVFRRPSAMVLPGPSIVSDSAHNVIIDFFASGGFPLLIAYLGIQLLVLISIVRIIRNMREFSITPVAMIAAWFGYTSQSIISINQIGLAVWGWVLGGALVGYSILNQPKEEILIKVKISSKNVESNRSEAAISLAAIVGMVVGFIIAFPPVRADIAWRSALKVGNAGAVESAMDMWPRNQRTLNSGIVLFANNGLPEKALEWARIDVKEHGENFVAWYTLYQLQGVSANEKAQILVKLKQLDPLNPEFADK